MVWFLFSTYAHGGRADVVPGRAAQACGNPIFRFARGLVRIVDESARRWPNSFQSASQERARDFRFPRVADTDVGVQVCIGTIEWEI